MSTTLSNRSSPLTERYGAGLCEAPLISLAASAYRVSLIRVDLPEPETPVIAVHSPEEIVRSTSVRLLPDAPSRLSCIFSLGLWRCFGTSICRPPLMYWPVRERGASTTLAVLPSATTYQQCPAARGTTCTNW